MVIQDRMRRAALFFAAGALLLVVGKYLLRDAGESGLGTIPLPAGPGTLPPAVAGIPCATDLHKTGTYHVHAQLALYVEGQPVTVPADVGIVKDPKTGQVLCMYWLHTHDESGTIHVEAPQPGTFTLGQFFAVAGVPLSLQNVGGFAVSQGKRVRAFVDGKELSPLTAEALHGIELLDGRRIVLEIGPPWATAR